MYLSNNIVNNMYYMFILALDLVKSIYLFILISRMSVNMLNISITILHHRPDLNGNKSFGLSWVFILRIIYLYTNVYIHVFYYCHFTFVSYMWYGIKSNQIQFRAIPRMLFNNSSHCCAIVPRIKRSPVDKIKSVK